MGTDRGARLARVAAAEKIYIYIQHFCEGDSCLIVGVDGGGAIDGAEDSASSRSPYVQGINAN